MPQLMDPIKANGQDPNIWLLRVFGHNST